MKNYHSIFLPLILPICFVACDRNESSPSTTVNITNAGPGDSLPDAQAVQAPANAPEAPLPVAQPYVEGQPAPQGAPAVAEDTQAAAEYFTPQLASYGQWVEVPDYGPCWQPAGVAADWRPYTIGHWAWSDQDGWLWVSDEPFGWACYHYGRWAQLQNGWCWVPGRTWGPAWVVWRGGDGLCGWAPLPPLRRGRTMAVEIQQIHPFAFNFVREEHLTDPHVREHFEPVTRNVTIINQTVNITKIEQVNGRIVDRGVEVAQVEKASGKKVERVTVAEARSPRDVAQNDRTATVFRPQVPAKPTARRAEPQPKPEAVRPDPGRPEPAQANPTPAVDPRRNEPAVVAPTPTPPAKADNTQQTRDYYDKLNADMQQRHARELQDVKEDAAKKQLQARQDAEKKVLQQQQQRVAPPVSPRPLPPAKVESPAPPVRGPAVERDSTPPAHLPAKMEERPAPPTKITPPPPVKPDDKTPDGRGQ